MGQHAGVILFNASFASAFYLVPTAACEVFACVQELWFRRLSACSCQRCRERRAVAQRTPGRPPQPPPPARHRRRRLCLPPRLLMAQWLHSRRLHSQARLPAFRQT